MNNSPLWFPCTQMQHLEQQPPLEVVSGKRAMLYTKQGDALVDMISSWWVNLHGHCHPYINEKIVEQLNTLEHTLLASVVHPQIERLATRLVQHMNVPTLNKVFFADSGSAAVEVALKMCVQYWQQQGEVSKTQFVCLAGGYHGETMGSLSVTDIPLFTQHYQPLMVSQIQIPSPANVPEGVDAQTHQQDCVTQLAQLLEQQHQYIAAIIVEPLVQGAAGMQMYHVSYLNALLALAKQYHVQVIFDEIAVGFGRTGSMFVAQQTTSAPDYVCLSKGLTAGYLPMSAVMTTQAVYDTFYDADVRKGFLHSHSFTGNPLAAAAANASLDIFEQQDVLNHNQSLIHVMAVGLNKLAQMACVYQPRQQGMIVAFSLRQQGQSFTSIQMNQLKQWMLAKGFLIRPIGHHVYLIPPYCITEQQLLDCFMVLAEGIEVVATIAEPKLSSIERSLAPITALP